MSRMDMQSAWADYKEKGFAEAREQLIIHYAHLAKYVANRLAINLSSVVEVDELISYGVEGLIDAIEKFDHKRNIKFETYAITRIRGSMIDGLRSMDWVPVSVRQKSKELEKTVNCFREQAGSFGYRRRNCTELGLSIKEFAVLLRDVSCSTIISLDDFLPGDNTADRKKRIVDTLEDHNSVDALELIGKQRNQGSPYVRTISEYRPEKEKKVVYLYYYEGLTLKEIGAILQLSESRISQLHTKAILRIRGSLSKKKFMICQK